MSNLELTVQVRTGGFVGPPADPATVLRALTHALDMLPLRRVVMGWAPDSPVYRQAADLLHSRDVQLFLWLPVLSEVGLLQPCSPVIGSDGHPAAAYHLDDTENFEFYCPTDPANLRAALDIFEQHFDATCFDGVLLDKIRYPSFASGTFGCFCPRCRARYDAAGLQFDGHNWRSFYDVRSGIILDALAPICAAFHQKGLRVGLDVFAPLLSKSVGQDIAALSKMADFIKPMMYAITNSPAGLPFELNGIDKVMGLKGDPREYCSLGFCAEQITWLQAVCDCPIHPGIEVNRLPGIADTTPEYVAACLQAYQGADGVVLSWNLLDMPPENLQAVAYS